MIPDRILKQLINRIHSFPELAGCPVGYYGDNLCRDLTGGSRCTGPVRVAVIIEEIYSADPAVAREMNRWASAPGGSPDGATNPAIVTNRSRAGRELTGAALSCGLTLVAAVGVFGGVAAEVPSGGASTFLVVASWTGMVMQGIQCVNGVVRLVEVASSPDSNSLDVWDQNALYTWSIRLVDFIGVATSIATLPAALRNLWAILARQRSLAARGLTLESLQRMNRHQRMAVIGEAVEEASRTPEGREALILAARQAGVGARSIQSTAGLSVRNADRMMRVVSQETTRRLHAALREIFGASAGSAASAAPERWIGSASGSVNYIINLIDAGEPARHTTFSEVQYSTAIA